MSITQSVGAEGISPVFPPPAVPAGGPSEAIPKIDPVPRHGSQRTGAGDGNSGQRIPEPGSAVNWDRLFRAYAGRLNCSPRSAMRRAPTSYRNDSARREVSNKEL